MAVETHAYLSTPHFRRTKALRRGGNPPTDALGSGSWPYGHNDPNWYQCVVQ